MNASGFIAMGIVFIVAIIMIGIGLSQYKSKKPVGFFSGEQPPAEEELSDVLSWNKKHGIMWIIYGLMILISYVIGVRISNSDWQLLLIFGGMFIPLIFMVWYHNTLLKNIRSNLLNNKSEYI